MESMKVALEIVLPLFLMMAAGYGVRMTGLMDPSAVKQANRLVFKVFLPILLFRNIYTTSLSDSFDAGLLAFAVAGVVVEFLLSLCIALLLEKDNARRGVMIQGMFRSNFVLFGIPVCTALFGDRASGLASILIAVIVPMFNMLSVVALEIFRGGKPSLGRTLRGIATNPLILASLLGILFLVFRIRLPAFLETTCSNLGGIATPLAFVILGASFDFKEIGGCLKPLVITLSVKLLLFPIVMLSAAILLGFREAALAVLLTVFAAPVAVSSFTMAQQMGGDDKLAAQLVIFSSILSILTMFLFIFLLRQFAFL